MASTTTKSRLRQTVFAVLFPLAFSVFAEGTSELRDLASRLQYASFVGNATGLQQSLEQLRRLSVDASASALKQNYQAYGEWKLAELLTAADKEGAAASAERCVDIAKPSTTDARSGAMNPEQLALQSICLNLLGELRAVRAVFYKRKRDQALTAAMTANSASPRVLLAQALVEQGQGNIEQNRARMTRAVGAFDNEQSEPGRPDWGYPEALTILGEYELAQGNALAARNALERALVLVPDYRRAQILLQQAAVR